MKKENVLNTASNIIFGNVSELSDENILLFLNSCVFGSAEDFNKNNFTWVLSAELKKDDCFIKELRKMLYCSYEYLNNFCVRDFGISYSEILGEELTEGDFDWTQKVTINNLTYFLKGIYNKRSGTVLPFSEGYKHLETVNKD